MLLAVHLKLRRTPYGRSTPGTKVTSTKVRAFGASVPELGETEKCEKSLAPSSGGLHAQSATTSFGLCMRTVYV